MISCKSAVLNVRWNPNCLVIFLEVLQSPKICSNGNWPFIFPLSPAMLWLLISKCVSVVLLIWASDSSMISEWDIKLPSLLVNILIINKTCPTYIFCSMSQPPVVASLTSLKQYAKALFTSLIASSSIKLQSTGSAEFFPTVISYWR